MLYYRRKDAKRRRCVRIGARSDVREGECFPHPGDPESCWPGISAAYDADQRVPLFKNGGISENKGKRAWLPLARRVDMDRVFHTIIERQDLFQDTKCVVTGNEASAVNRLKYMNLYRAHTNVQILSQPTKITIAVSDIWTKERRAEASTSGAKLVVRNGDGNALLGIRIVASVLEENDFDVRADR